MSDRGDNRSRQPQSSAFRDFIGSGWGPRPTELPARERVADFLNDRTLKAGAPFPGERLVVPAGPYKVRSNDCDYRFRAHSAFAHLSGLGGEKEPDTVLVLEPNDDGTHTPLLFFKPRTSRSSKEFYADARYGEFWGRSLETTPARVTPLEVIDGRKKDCEGRELGVTNRDYVFDFERDGDQLDELLDSLDEKWGES